MMYESVRLKEEMVEMADVVTGLYSRVLPEPLPTLIHHWGPGMLLWMWREVHFHYLACRGPLHNGNCLNPWYHAELFGAEIPSDRRPHLGNPDSPWYFKLPYLRPGMKLEPWVYSRPGEFSEKDFKPPEPEPEDPSPSDTKRASRPRRASRRPPTPAGRAAACPSRTSTQQPLPDF